MKLVPVRVTNARKSSFVYYGEVRKVIIYDRHKDGIASVIFKQADEADVCSTAMNNRMWGTRLITAEAWDGNTKYEVEETEAEREKRIQEWGNFLDGGEEGKGKTQGKKGGEDKTDGTKNDPVTPDNIDSESDSTSPSEQAEQTEDASFTESMETDFNRSHWMAALYDVKTQFMWVLQISQLSPPYDTVLLLTSCVLPSDIVAHQHICYSSLLYYVICVRCVCLMYICPTNTFPCKILINLSEMSPA